MASQSIAGALEDDKHVKEILAAASSNDNLLLQRLLKQHKFPEVDAVDVQDISGTSPLHAAIVAGAVTKIKSSAGESKTNAKEEAICETVKLLLENGAIWNQLDKNDETPGCIAYRLGLSNAYQLMVDAGVRAEILLNRLEGYNVLGDEDESMEEQPKGHVSVDDAKDEEEVPELIVAQKEDQTSIVADGTGSSEYLSSTLSLTRDKLLDDKQNGVMMAWESDIMRRSVEALLPEPALQILNIGAGMMIFDTFVQESPNRPTQHHIVEAHPDVITNMSSQGWNQKSGVVVHTGRWQEVLPRLLSENQTFDAIYYDTFAESYADFKDFFSEYVLELLTQDGKWSFFNGMGADRQISYDVYQKVVELDLFEAGFDVEWIEIDLPHLDQEWKGVKRKYWNIDKYRLPVCKFMD